MDARISTIAAPLRILPKPPAPRISSATSALGKDSILPVVGVCLKSANGKTREGNVFNNNVGFLCLIHFRWSYNSTYE